MRSEPKLRPSTASWVLGWRLLSALLVTTMLCGACGADKTNNAPDVLSDIGVDDGAATDSRQPLDELSPDLADWDQRNDVFPHDTAPEVEDATVPTDALDADFSSEELFMADEISQLDLELLSDTFTPEDIETWDEADWTEDSALDADDWIEDSGDDIADLDVWTEDTDVAPDVSELCVDKDPQPWSRKVDLAGGTVVFAELMYRPSGTSNLTWVELYNPFSIDMDISGWTLAGDISYVFQESTMIPPGGYLVVASDPGALDQTGPLPTLGPWTGMLPPWSGTIELRNNTDRLMDVVRWSAQEPSP